MITVISSIFVAVVGWYLNKRSKRLDEEYQRKEEKYAMLIRNIKGFTIGSFNKEMIEEFIEQVNLCWLYCPDKIIKKAYAFLNMVHADQKCNDAEMETALGDLVLSIRRDLITRKPVKSTHLKTNDFKLLRANSKSKMID